MTKSTCRPSFEDPNFEDVEPKVLEHNSQALTPADLETRVANLSICQRIALAERLANSTSQQLTPAPSQKLVAYVVPSDQQDTTENTSHLKTDFEAALKSDLREHLKSQLPHYMLPSAVVVLQALPRSANGKIDIQALPAPPTAKSTQPTSATTPTELLLTQIWQTVLQLKSIGIHDNFFDLGGDSILSIQLVSKAREHQLKLAPNQLFEHPTIAELAAAIDRASQPAMPASSDVSDNADPDSSEPNTFKADSFKLPLVPLNPRGTRPPLFFHGGSAEALTWARFSDLLGPDQPFYALQHPSLEPGSGSRSDSRQNADNTVEALAKSCIAVIRKVQPTGPYLIGGHCFGGAIAFEIANQLQAQGETLCGLIAIDAYCPNSAPPTPIGQLQDRLQLAYYILRKSYYYHGGAQLRQLPHKIWQQIQQIQQRQNRLSPVNIPPPEEMLSRETSPEKASPEEIPYEVRYERAHQACVSASNRYHPQPHQGRLQLFRARTQAFDWHYGPALGWQTIIPSQDLIITNIPGLSGNLFNQKSGPLLAQQVKAYLDTLQ